MSDEQPPQSDEQPQKRSAWRKTGNAAWRVLLPFHSMRGTYNAVRNEAQRNRENLAAIREMGRAARDTLMARRDVRDQSFDEAMQNRALGALDIADLYRFFLRRKRAALVAIFIFLIMAAIGVLKGAAADSLHLVFLSLLSVLASFPLFFIIALGAQLRLWQLTTHRLSREEKGGLHDFMRVPGWWLAVLDPEIGRALPRATDSTESTDHAADEQGNNT